MNETYLPGSARERILDLMKHQKVTQKDLAQRIDITESALSRFLSGTTDRLDSEYLLRIARCFGVSTDFLLGETAEGNRNSKPERNDPGGRSTDAPGDRCGRKRSFPGAAGDQS